MRAHRILEVLLLLVVLHAIAAGGCAKRGDVGSTAGPSDDASANATPVDVDLMAFLSEARALHHEANIHEAADEPVAAIVALDHLVHARRPHEGTTVPEIEEVIADTHARLAELRLKTADLDGASREVNEGMAHAPGATYFRGHLLEVDGIIEEARAAHLTDAGRKDDAQKARARAIQLLHEAVEVQERVIAATLGASPATTRLFEGGKQ